MKKLTVIITFIIITLTLSSCIKQNGIADDSTTQPEEDLLEINKLREDYDFGTCKNLRDDVSVILFYMDDFESEWTDQEIDKFTKEEIEPGLDFLETEAQKYGVKLDLSIKKVYRSLFYDDEVITSVRDTGLATIDVLTQAAKGIGFSSSERMIKRFCSIYKTEEVVCFTIFNKNGTSYAINPKRGSEFKADEHCIVFSRDLNSAGNDPVGSQSSVVAHEMLHLFGAEDFYAIASRKSLAQRYYPYDVMLSTNYYISINNIGDATAFYIGWTDQIPNVFDKEGW